LKKIFYYITDHGLGHATRSIAIIRELEKLQNVEVIIRNSNANKILHESLPHTKIITGTTDVGPVINDDGISINKEQTITKITKWLQNIDSFAKKELKIILENKPDLIISDISPMPLLAVKDIKIPIIVISNFSWYDVLKILPKKESEKLKIAYDRADLAIQIPLGTKMEHFRHKRRTGLICRIPTRSKNKIKKSFGISNSKSIVTVALGGSKNKIKFEVGEDVEILSMNTKVDSSIRSKDVTNYVEGQDIVSISDLVICKCGYGMISECITNGVPFYFLASNTHLEQKAMVNELKEAGFGDKITFKKINKLKLTSKFIKSKPTSKKKRISNQKIVNLISKMISSQDVRKKR